MVFNNKILGSHYIVKERPPYKKDFDDADICIVGNIRIDDTNERQLYTPSFTVSETYLKDEKTVRLVDDVKEGNKFHSIDFRKFDMGGAKLDGGDFSFSTFDEINMIGVKMKGAILKGASLCGADLRGADLSGADLEGADLRFCNLEGAKLDGANLSGAKLDGAFFKAAKLANIKADKKTLNELEALLQMLDDLVTGKVSIKDIPKEWLSFIDLSKLDLSGVDLTNFDLRLLNTTGVDLSSATLTPDQIDGTYMFKSGANSDTVVKVARGNTAGLDLTSANLINEEIEDQKRKKHLRHVIHKHAREEALQVIEEQKKLLQNKSEAEAKNNYLKQRPAVKKFLGENECDGVDLEEKILTMEKNRMMNPESEWDIPRSNPMVNRAVDRVLTDELMWDVKAADYGYKYEKELEEKNLNMERDRELEQIAHEERKADKLHLQQEEDALLREQEELAAAAAKELEEQMAKDDDGQAENNNAESDGNADDDINNLVSHQARQRIRLNVRGTRQHNKA